MSTVFSEKKYDAIANICVFAAVGSAILYDHFPQWRWEFLLLGVASGLVAVGAYFKFHAQSKSLNPKAPYFPAPEARNTNRPEEARSGTVTVDFAPPESWNTREYVSAKRYIYRSFHADVHSYVKVIEESARDAAYQAIRNYLANYVVVGSVELKSVKPGPIPSTEIEDRWAEYLNLRKSDFLGGKVSKGRVRIPRSIRFPLWAVSAEEDTVH